MKQRQLGKNRIAAQGYSKAYRIVFMQGRQKRIWEEYMDGIPQLQWYQGAADNITRLQVGDYHLIEPGPPSSHARSSTWQPILCEWRNGYRGEL